MERQKICVAGGGSWGSALAHLAACNGHEVTLYLRDEKVCTAINTQHENTHYLPGLRLHEGVRASTDPAVLSTSLLILAIPCQQQRSFLGLHGSRLTPGCTILNVAKGIEDVSGCTASQFLPSVLEGHAFTYAVLSGPSFAREVLEGQPTAVVIASTAMDRAEHMQDLLSSACFRCYTSTDVLGVEIGGAVKNVIAIAAGLCDGLSIGTNGRAALLTRGLAEISRLGVALGARAQTFMGLSGLGDLMLTCAGELSRNRQVGLRLGRGERLEDIVADMHMVAEGVKTTRAVNALARKIDVDMPITSAMDSLLDGRLAPRQAAELLMSRALKEEGI